MLSMIRRILKISGKYKGRIETAFIFSFLKSLLMNAGIILTVFVVDRYLTGRLDGHFCLMAGLLLLGLTILQALCIHASDRLQSAAGFMLMADLRVRLGEHLRKMPMGYFTAGNIGKISSVLSTDMVFIEENVMMTLADSMSDIFSQIIMICIIMVFNPVLGVVALIGAALMIFFGERKFKNGIQDSSVRQEQSENLTEAVIDFAEGIGIIKTYNMLGEKSAELTGNFDRSCETSLTFEDHQVPHSRMVSLVYEFCSVALIVTAIFLYVKGILSVTYFLGMLLFVFDMFAPVKILFLDSEKLTIMDKCLDRLEEVMEEKELEDGGEAAFPEHADAADKIVFEDVHFSYGNKEVIKGVSFTAKEGETTAIVGPSGSGKTTLVNLLARFWDIDSGSIRINGKDIREVPLAALLDQISMVFQNVYLFRDTVYNNISMGRPDATEEEVIEAAKKARCYDFIMALPDGFQTMIGEGGASLSGGEKQRISIARCILKDAPVVILDEATASVDADNEAAIQQAISELCRGKTLIVIAHRLETIKNADCILVVEDGIISGKGTHEDLIRAGGTYRNFVEARSRDMGWNKRKTG